MRLPHRLKASSSSFRPSRAASRGRGYNLGVNLTPTEPATGASRSRHDDQRQATMKSVSMRIAVATLSALVCGAVTAVSIAAEPRVVDAAATPPSADDADTAAFNDQIAPLLVRCCLECHSPGDPHGGLDLSSRERAIAGGDSGAVLVPGRPGESVLIQRLRDGSMPPEGKTPRPTADEIAQLENWIAAGAAWPAGQTLDPLARTTEHRAGRDWWSLQAVRRPDMPAVKDASRIATPIDSFLLARLEQENATYSAAADRVSLVRRLTFDLTGLPPTPEEVQAFVADVSADAYARVVERLLASPGFGERWAQHWLDVVRFSESMGFERDRLRQHAWRYRDWVVAAMNADMPYDEFVRRQLAGDSLAPDDAAAAVPTGFLVTGPNNDVGNGSELERRRERADELDDFVTTTTSALLGLTVGCARCHDHKFDPIASRDYYRIAAALSGVRFGDRPLETAAASAARSEKRKALDQRKEALATERAELDARVDQSSGVASSVRNEIAFAAVSARFVRLEIDRTRDGAEPCIDEIELFAADEQSAEPAANDAARPNLAAAATGAKASASSLLAGFAIHQVAHLNDGQVGNAHSWISADTRGWAQIELARPREIARVVWGRDREGQFRDRVAQEYRVLVSLDGAEWKVVAERPEPTGNDELTAARSKAEFAAARAEIDRRQAELDAEVAAIPAPPVTWAAVSQAPDAVHLLKRGDVQQPADEMTAGGLFCLAGLSGELNLTTGATDAERRRALANWIVDRRNPLTARVIVNRLWQHHFGAGLVENPSDLGFGGGRPSHPELLDWLADELVVSGWRLKHIHRLILLSSAYQQTSQIAPPGSDSARAAASDPTNRLLARFSRRRLSAEEVRDGMLATAGTLDSTVGGPSYRFFQYTDGNIPIFEPLADDAPALVDPPRWRRTLYRHIVRSHTSPLLDVFDCPDPSVQTPKRSQTTTPTQSLSLLNNPLVARQSELLAERVVRDVGVDPAAQVERAAWLVWSRAPATEEQARLEAFVQRFGLRALGRVLCNTSEYLYVQ